MHFSQFAGYDDTDDEKNGRVEVIVEGQAPDAAVDVSQAFRCENGEEGHRKTRRDSIHQSRD